MITIQTQAERLDNPTIMSFLAGRFGAGGGSSRPTPAPPYVKPERKLQPPPAYVPQPSEGENALRLVDLPSEILETIFLECDLPELVACKRVRPLFVDLPTCRAHTSVSWHRSAKRSIRFCLR